MRRAHFAPRYERFWTIMELNTLKWKSIQFLKERLVFRITERCQLSLLMMKSRYTLLNTGVLFSLLTTDQ